MQSQPSGLPILELSNFLSDQPEGRSQLSPTLESPGSLRLADAGPTPGIRDSKATGLGIRI